MKDKEKRYTCTNCGFVSYSYLGKCPECGSFNSFELEEDREIFKREQRERLIFFKSDELKLIETKRIKSNIEEFDRVLGGGIVESSVILLGGEPGIGKSTLLSEYIEGLPKSLKVLYASGEESKEQILLRLKRIGTIREGLYLFVGNYLNDLLMLLEEIKPDILIIDSIQSFNFNENSSFINGNVSNLRNVTSAIVNYSKKKNIRTFLIGHVTKEGVIAGPKYIEHLVDVVLYLEGDRFGVYKTLKAVKNRYGSTGEMGFFEMTQEGLKEIKNPLEFFIFNRESLPAGSVITSFFEGTTSLLIEVQALAITSYFPMPRRISTGIDYNRLLLLIAILEKRGGVSLNNKDIYINISGGIKIEERASDLAIALSIISSLKDRKVKEKAVYMGELGLGGELRTISNITQRINSAVKLGFNNFIIPKDNLKETVKKASYNVTGIRSLEEAIKISELS